MKTKKKDISKLLEPVLEDMPKEFTKTENIVDNSFPLPVMIADIINDGRNAMYEAIDGMIISVMSQISSLYQRRTITEEEIDGLDSSIAGVKRSTLLAIFSKDVIEIQKMVDSENKALYESEFLDVESLTKRAVRSLYPNAFKKWDTIEDQLLKDMYSKGESWTGISKALQRNVNAVKIRAERLNIASNTGARSRY